MPECPPELFSVLIRGLKEHSSWNSNLIPIRAACLRSATAGGLLLKFCNGMDPVSGFWWRGLTGIPFTGWILRMNYRKNFEPNRRNKMCRPSEQLTLVIQMITYLQKNCQTENFVRQLLTYLRLYFSPFSIIKQYFH